MKTSSSIIVWFRNDLRVHDHEPLWKAAQKAANVIPVYCLDPRLFQMTDLGFPKTGSYRAKFLLESIADLQSSLQKLGTSLVFKIGKPEEVIPQMAKQYEVAAVYASKEVTHEEVTTESILSNMLLKYGVELDLFWTATLYHPDDLPFPVSALPDVFTNFRKAVEKYTAIRPVFPTPTRLTPHQIGSDPMPTLPDLGLEEITPDERGVMLFKGGERHGLARLQEYFWKKNLLKNYKETRNGLVGADYSSKFSPWLASGSLSPRLIYQEVKAYEKDRVANESTYWLIFELIWRDYFRMVAKKYGNLLFFSGGIKNQPIRNTGRKQEFLKWIEGNTGIPFIDANMRELAATGFMSNRGRQNVACFLVKDLYVDWRWGASYFESLLLDYDPCSNWGNWNYVAGVGNDPREDRYFNILSQAKNYDPKGAFVRHWLPELSELPDGLVHTPFYLNSTQQSEFNVRLGVDYPKPMFDIAKWKSAK